MKVLSIIFLALILVSCNQENSEPSSLDSLDLPEQIVYVGDPDSDDKLCISEIERAKKDVEKGKIYFIQKFGFGTSEYRYEDELKELCGKYGLIFDTDLISCIVEEGQTQGCYGDYMDRVLIERFGLGFKEKLHREADSLLLINAKDKSKLIRYWDCDERPRLPNEFNRTNDYLPSIKVKDIDIKENHGDYGGWPFFDISFTVNKDSTTSDFYICYFAAQLDENKKFKNELFEIVVKHIKSKYPLWVPGKINGIPVKTDNNIRIHMIKDQNAI